MAYWLFFFFSLLKYYTVWRYKKNKPNGDYLILLQEWKEKYFLKMPSWRPCIPYSKFQTELFILFSLTRGRGRDNKANQIKFAIIAFLLCSKKLKNYKVSSLKNFNLKTFWWLLTFVCVCVCALRQTHLGRKWSSHGTKHDLVNQFNNSLMNTNKWGRDKTIFYFTV